MFTLIKKIFGTAQSRKVNKYQKLVSKIREQEKIYQKLSDEELVEMTSAFKKRIQEGESIDSLLIEAFAAVINACRRLQGTPIHVSGYEQKWDLLPYDVQIIGAIALHYGSIAEMQTGEGKTLTASMPLYLNALSGKATHLVTANDYLAKRDCEWIGVIFKKLGLSVASLTGATPIENRKEVYQHDIVYGTASEFGFDYLRDNSMALSAKDQCQREPFFAIIDEVDSILIDEARTPLIISGPSSVSRQMYDALKTPVSFLVKEQRELCNKIANEARKKLDQFDLFAEKELPKFSKEEKEIIDEAFCSLWLVSKGMPRHRTLKRVRENPDLRAKIDAWDTYFFAEPNRKERAEHISKLFIVVDEKSNEFELTDRGIQRWAEIENGSEKDFVMLDLGHEYSLIEKDTSLTNEQKLEKKVALREDDSHRKERMHNLRQLFRAHLLMEKDVDYILDQQKIVIIDENTGRPQPGRRFSDGLHQAIEAKEGVAIQRETQTFATITLQNYFRMYKKLAGMTGTAITEAGEFKEIYKLEVLQIPTYLPCVRNDFNDEVYMTEREKYQAILKEIIAINQQGRPILIGTESVEVSEKLSRILRQARLSHNILNAKNHSKEAEIIANAGSRGAITISTNMAGRGTDIKLSKEVITLGGLHVIGTTRHPSRRIDRQLRGRSGRLGDPGSSKFFVSFEDSLMRLFSSPRLTGMLQRFRPPEGEPISAGILNRSIETAQKRVEQRNYQMRKHTLEYDDVMNKHRQEIYAFRNEVLHTEDNKQLSIEVVESAILMVMAEYLKPTSQVELTDLLSLREALLPIFPISFEKEEILSHTNRMDLEKFIIDTIVKALEQKLSFQEELILDATHNSEKAKELLAHILKNLMIREVDTLWQEHLLKIDHLRSDVALCVVGQKDPLIEFKHQAFELFESFSKNLQKQISANLFRFRFEMVSEREEQLHRAMQQKMQMHKPDVPEELSSQEQQHIQEEPTTIISSEQKQQRNELCSCGSGKKYKKCCANKSDL